MNETNMKRAFVLVAISMASFGSAMFAGACIGDAPGALPNIPEKDAAQPDTSTLPDAADAGPPVVKTVEGLSLWLDGADSNSVQRRQPGNDETVLKWLDKSGSNPSRDYAPAAGADGHPPKFAPGSMNGHTMSSVVFTQTGFQFLVGPKYTFSEAEAFIVFQTVPRKVAAGDPLPNYGLWQFGIYPSQHPSGGDASNETRESFGTGGVSLVTAEIPSSEFWDPQIFGVTTSGTYGAYYDGVPLKAVNQGEHQLRGVVFNPGGSLLGASNSGTSDIVPSSWFNGYIAEVIIYNRVLSTPDHDKVQSYLSAKWGIPLKNDGGT